MDSLVQNSGYSDYYYSIGLISSNTKKNYHATENQIRYDYSRNNIQRAKSGFDKFTFFYPNDDLGGVNIYNYETYRSYYEEYSNIWYNLKSTKNMMGVPSWIEYLDCNYDVFYAFTIDIAQSFKPEL